MRKVLVVDDSALMRKTMCDIINSVPEFEVADICRDGKSALKAVLENSYGCIVMNVYLSGVMSGITLLKTLADQKSRIPVIAITSAVREDREVTVQALDAGVVDMVVRPYFFSDKAGTEKFRQSLIAALKAVSSGKAVSGFADRISQTVSPVKRKGKYSLVALACSTGGPQALHRMIPMLPEHIGVPMVVVQHMPAGFTASLAERINQDSSIHVKEACDQEILMPDTVYIAPGGRHFTVVEDRSMRLTAHVYDAPPVHNLRPCADVMYESLCKVRSDNILCVVLTGMGADGTEGIGELKKSKHIYTISQDEESCVVYGMPKSVHDKGLSDEVKPITEIAKSISRELGV